MSLESKPTVMTEASRNAKETWVAEILGIGSPKHWAD